MRILSLLSLLSLGALGALAGPLAAQTALNEQFNYSTTATFPPTGWANNNLNGGSFPGWEETSALTHSLQFATLVADAAGHDDQLSSVTNDYGLQAPTMNLAAYATPQLGFDSEVYYAQWMANHPSTVGNGVSTVELSTDGGATWSQEWIDTATANGYYPGQSVALGAYAGQSAVELRFHYYGTYAHCWAVDNVVVDNGGTPVGPSLAIVGACPGPASANASGMTAGGPVIFYYATTAGSFTVGGGACAGLTVPVANPTQLGPVVLADGAGNVSLNGTQQPNHCGNVRVGAVDVATCSATNVVTL